MPPTASRNGTAKTVLLRRAIWCAIHAASATTAPMPPDAMFHRSAAKAVRATPCRNRHGVAFVSKAAPFIPPLCRPAAVTASARPPCYSGRSRERPAAARKSRGNLSAPLRRAVNAVSTAAKACSGSVPPICGKNSEPCRAAPIQTAVPKPALCYSAKTAYKPSKRHRCTPERFPCRVSSEQRPPSLPTARKRRRN